MADKGDKDEVKALEVVGAGDAPCVVNGCYEVSAGSAHIAPFPTLKKRKGRKRRKRKSSRKPEPQSVVGRRWRDSKQAPHSLDL